MMYEVLLELIRAVIWIGLTIYLARMGNRSNLIEKPGYRLMG